MRKAPRWSQCSEPLEAETPTEGEGRCSCTAQTADPSCAKKRLGAGMKTPEAIHAEQLAHDDLQGRGELIVMLDGSPPYPGHKGHS